MELTEKDRLKINYTDSESFVQCYNVLEFPNLNIIEDGEHFVIKQNDFKALINKSIFSTAVDDTRPVLKGCLFEIEKDHIKSSLL